MEYSGKRNIKSLDSRDWHRKISDACNNRSAASPKISEKYVSESLIEPVDKKLRKSNPKRK
jgi:hypothetical protein